MIKRLMLVVLIVGSASCAARDPVRSVAIYTDTVANVMLQLQDSAEFAHDQQLIGDAEFQAYLRAAEPVAEAGLKLSQAIQVYEMNKTEEARGQVLAALDALSVLLPSLFDSLETGELRTKIGELVTELMKLINTIRGDLL